jgi:hypothetical protein
LSLSTKNKVELLKFLDQGASVKSCDRNGNWLSAIYDLKKQKDKLLKFYSDSNVPNLIVARKTLHQAKNISVDKVLMEWIQQHHSEKFPLTHSLIVAGAKIFHEELGLSTLCEYSSGWYG